MDNMIVPPALMSKAQSLVIKASRLGIDTRRVCLWLSYLSIVFRFLFDAIILLLILCLCIEKMYGQKHDVIGEILYGIALFCHTNTSRKMIFVIHKNLIRYFRVLRHDHSVVSPLYYPDYKDSYTNLVVPYGIIAVSSLAFGSFVFGLSLLMFETMFYLLLVLSCCRHTPPRKRTKTVEQKSSIFATA